MRTRTVRFAVAALSMAALPAIADTSPEEQAANTAKAIAEAQKAQIDLEVAALKAKLGSDVKAPFDGSVKTGDKAGTIEAQILSSDAVNAAAREIAARVKAANPAAIVLVAQSEMPKFDSLISYRAGRAVFDKLYKDTEKATKDVRPAPAAEGIRAKAVAPVAGALLGLDALNKLLGFFRTDYSITAITTEVDDSMLVQAVAGALAKSDIATTLPIQYNAPAIAIADTTILESLEALAKQHGDALTKAANFEKMYKDTAALAAKATGDEKKKLEEAAEKQKDAWDKWKAVLAVYDGMFGKLATPDEKGNVPIVAVIKESAIADALRCPDAAHCAGQLLVVKASKAGGSAYTKSNLWTSLGGMPFYVTGGVVVSFVLFRDARVAAAGLIPIHDGYRRVDEIENSFAPAKPPTN